MLHCARKRDASATVQNTCNSFGGKKSETKQSVGGWDPDMSRERMQMRARTGGPGSTGASAPVTAPTLVRPKSSQEYLRGGRDTLRVAGSRKTEKSKEGKALGQHTTFLNV